MEICWNEIDRKINRDLKIEDKIFSVTFALLFIRQFMTELVKKTMDCNLVVYIDVICNIYVLFIA
mgnify:CR=1 FL=1